MNRIHSSKKRIKQLLLLMCLLFLCVIVYGSNFGVVEIETIVENGTDVVGEIDAETEIKQNFISTRNNLCGIAIQFGTYMRNNDSKVEIVIKEAITGRRVHSVKLDAENIVDNEYRSIMFPPVQNSKNKEYVVTISSNADKDNAVTLYMNANDLSENSLFVNGKGVQGSLNFKTFYNDNLFFKLINQLGI